MYNINYKFCDFLILSYGILDKWEICYAPKNRRSFKLGEFLKFLINTNMDKVISYSQDESIALTVVSDEFFKYAQNLPYDTHSNFISKSECEKLINRNVTKYCNKEKTQVYHPDVSNIRSINIKNLKELNTEESFQKFSEYSNSDKLDTSSLKTEFDCILNLMNLSKSYYKDEYNCRLVIWDNLP